MASADLGFGTTSFTSRQNTKAQCALKAAIPQSSPLYSNHGMLHLIVSTAAGQPR
jgi:hypothetical protein